VGKPLVRADVEALVSITRSQFHSLTYTQSSGFSYICGIGRRYLEYSGRLRAQQASEKALHVFVTAQRGVEGARFVGAMSLQCAAPRRVAAGRTHQSL
jgi:hypothetical protein